MSGMADTYDLVMRWEERVSVSRCDCRGSSCEVKMSEQQMLEQWKVNIVEATRVGVALLRLLGQMSHEESDGFKSNEKTELGLDTAWPRWRLNELLVEAVLILVETCVQWMEIKGHVDVICCELKASSCHKRSEEQDFQKVLHSWREYNEIAERGWRWCDAHLTLLPTDESKWCHKALHDVATVTDWWWRPDVASDINLRSAQEKNLFILQQLFKDVFTGVNVPSSGGFSHVELRDCIEFFEVLYTSSARLFVHRIPTKHNVLQRSFTAKATALFYQAHFLSCLAFLKGVARPCSTDKKNEREESRFIKNHELLWVSREGLSLAWQSLISAATTVQVIAAHFNDPCECLKRRIRWALFGVKDVLGGKNDLPPCSDINPFFLHPFVEPSENPWRITQGVGLVATGKICEGSVILQERPLMSVNVTHQLSIASDPQSSELSTVTTAALELFQRGGLAHSNDAVITQVAENIQSGALFGQATRFVDMWSALHLIAAMPVVRDESVSAGDSFARDIAALLRSWKERAIEARSVEDFRIQQSEAQGQRKALYPVASLINHSCSPNALRVFSTLENADLSCEGNLLCVVALCDIEPGEEITVTYLPSPLLSRSAKRLRNGFCCRCAFCQSRTPLLEGVVCPACQQLVYDDGDVDSDTSNKNKNDLSRTDHVVPCTKVLGIAERRVTPYSHATDCIFSECSNYKELARQFVQGFKKALCNVYNEFLNGNNTDTMGENGGYMQENHVNTVERTKEEEQYARRAKKTVRQLMDLDFFARGLPATHYYRLQTRMQCLATSLNAHVTAHDSTRLVQLCEDLLEDLEKLLPRNYPLLTGIRLHYCLARSRHLIATSEANDISVTEHFNYCCGSINEKEEMVQLPFIQDAVIRECVVRSFQEYYVCAGWNIAEANEYEILHSFLEHYKAELLLCGIDSVSHLNMLSLMCDATQNSNVEMCA